VRKKGSPLTRIKIGESLFEIPDEWWETYVRERRIPPDAWVLSPVWTNGAWRIADSLEVYHLFLPSPPRSLPAPAPGVTDTIFPRRGLSMTELLVLVNLAVTCILYLFWKDAYPERLRDLAGSLRGLLRSAPGYPSIIVPVFLHATPSHLFFNMVSLFASGGVIEYFYGRRKMVLAYLVCGIASIAFSVALRPRPFVSVGASGAVYGLYGLAVLFLLRNFRRFNAVQRWKTVRIYLPLASLAILPSIAGERTDFYAHLGGLLCGFLVGLILRPGPRLHVVTDPLRVPESAAS
jgi:rhomboid protease GluP